MLPRQSVRLKQGSEDIVLLRSFSLSSSYRGSARSNLLSIAVTFVWLHLLGLFCDVFITPIATCARIPQSYMFPCCGSRVCMCAPESENHVCQAQGLIHGWVTKARAQASVRAGAKSDGAEPDAPAGTGSTSSSSAAEEERRQNGSTSFQQHLKKNLIQPVTHAWYLSRQHVHVLCLPTSEQGYKQKDRQPLTHVEDLLARNWQELSCRAHWTKS